jgi:spore coat protein U-like protein
MRSLLFVTLLPAVAAAATVTDTMNVTATVVASCNVSANNLVFGNYDPLGGDVDGSATIAVTCSNGAGWTLNLDGGSEGSTAARKMNDGGSNKLSYQLFSNAARTQVWDDGTASNATGTGSGSAQTQTVYGRIAGSQSSVPIGSYSDTITATVIY